MTIMRRISHYAKSKMNLNDAFNEPKCSLCLFFLPYSKLASLVFKAILIN